jgi:hypothetical protein
MGRPGLEAHTHTPTVSHSPNQQNERVISIFKLKGKNRQKEQDNSFNSDANSSMAVYTPLRPQNGPAVDYRPTVLAHGD